MTTNSSVTTNGQQDQNLGTWVQATAYNANDIVLYNGNLWRANANIPANTAFTVGTTGATWTLTVINGVSGGAITQMTIGGGAGSLMVLTSLGKVYSAVSASGPARSPGSGRADTQGNAGFPGIQNMSQVFLFDAVINFEEPGIATWIGYHGSVAYVLCSTGNLWAWGKNGSGQLGIGSTTDSWLPRRIRQNVAEVYTHPTANNAATVVGGITQAINTTRTVVRGTDNKIYACGYNATGALGLGDTTDRTSFVELTWAQGVGGVRNVWNLGSQFGCILVETNQGGELATFLIAGYNGWGSFGNGSTTNASTPVNITNAWTGQNNTSFRIRYATGGFGYSDTGQINYTWMSLWLQFSLTPTSSQVKTSGYNGWGVSGNGLSGLGVFTTTPFTIVLGGNGTFDVKQISGRSAGVGTMYVLLTDGNLWAWGRNFEGQLGNGTTVDRTTPQLINTNVKEILWDNVASIGNDYVVTSYIRKNDGTYWSTASNSFGNTGTGLSTAKIVSWTRMMIPRTRDWAVLGSQNSIGETNNPVMYDSNGILWTWGYNEYGMTWPSGTNAGSWFIPTQVNPSSL